MKKPNIKHQYLTGIVLTILAWIALVQATDTLGPVVRTASANQVLKAPSLELPREGLDLVTFSPDGNTLASADFDGQIELWDVASGQMRVTLPSQFASLVSGIVFSPDGNTLASVSDNSIQLWDAASGEARLILPVSDLVTDLVFSPDGKILASVSLDARITLRDSQSGSTTQFLTGHQSVINAIAFSPDSKILVTSGQDAQTKIWDMKTGQERASLPGVGGIAVTELEFSPDGKIFAVVSQDGRITLRKSQSGSTIQVLTGHQGGVNAIAFSPDSKILATGGQDAQIKLWDMKTGLEQASLPGEGPAAVTGLVFSPNGKTLASVGESQTVFLWDMDNKLSQFLTGHSDWVDKVIFSSNQKTLASVGKTGQVVVWGLNTGLEQQTFQIPSLFSASLAGSQASLSGSTVSNTSSQLNASNTPSVAKNASTLDGSSQVASKDKTEKSKKKSAKNWKGVRAIAISQDGLEIGTASKDGMVRVFKKNGNQRWEVSGHHGNAIAGIAFRGKSKEWVSAGRDTEIKTWNGSGKKLQTFYGPEHPPRAIAVSPDGRFIATAGEETRVFLYDAVAGKLSGIFSGHVDFVNGLAFSPDGKMLASAGAEGRILLWEVATGKRLGTLLGHADEVNAVAFSPDGGLLASASVDSTVILWNLTTGRQIKTLAGHQGSVRSVAFSADGKKLVSAGEDTRMLVWDPATGLLKNQLPGPPAAINDLAFGPDGNLHAASENSEVSEFDKDTGTKVQTIVVPDSSSVPPQVSRSEALTLATASNSGLLTPSLYVEKQSIAEVKQNNTILYSIVNQLLDWVIPAANAALPAPPGGPILIVTNGSPSFGNYYAEILRTEGFNEFAVADISTVNATTLAAYDVVILAEMPLDAATQVPVFANWVNSGGNLIAMRPDKDLASVLGLTDASSTLDNGYLLVNTSASPGNGIVGETMQFHGTADRYTSNGATVIATLYSNAATATSNPAVTLRSVGTAGGQAAAFTYDLAKSIVYTRQGNPAWASQERDGYAPIRSDDKFFGNATGDPQVDWVDFNKIAIPQADEQQRLLANLILEMNRDKKPLPRFWYFPNGKKAVVIMTGDDHANNGTQGRFDQFIANSPPGCSVADWECIRGTSYIFPNTPLTNAQAASYNAQGFEVGLHINTNCADFTPTSLRTFYTEQIDAFRTKYSSIPAPITQRHHCIAWSDWITGAIVQLENGIRFDTSYYFWPPSWVLNRPGFFSGSGMPMRFADLDSSIIDVYHASSQMTDESGQSYPFTIDTLLDRALGIEGYYGAFTINAHTDVATITESNAVIASAPPRGVPIVSSKQMLDWLDGRNTSSFGSLTWSGDSLSFTVTRGNGANNLRGMLPASSTAGALLNIVFTPTSGGSPAPLSFTVDNIKGVPYGFFPASAGTYTATYGADTTPPTVESKSPSDGATNVSLGATVNAVFNKSIDVATINSSTFELRDSANALVNASINYNANTRTVTLTPSASLAASTTYTAFIKGGTTGVKDLAGNALASDVSRSFTTEAQPCVSTPCSSWSSSAIPGTPSVNDPGSVELGVKFRSDLSGYVTGIRFYKGSTNTGTHTGTLWSESGVQLATATFAGETASGWQQVNFSAPVAIAAGTTYLASYHAPNGNYAATTAPEFAVQGVDTPPIHLLKDGVSGGNGVYAYSASSSFPNNTFNATNYWVDVVFTTTLGSDTTAPTVTAQSPAAGATGVAVNSGVTATFSEVMDASTITASTVELRGPGNALIPATVSYNASTFTVTLTPNAALSTLTAYTATIRGGTTDPRVKDAAAAGNALASNSTWTFTTADTLATGCSGSTNLIWPGNPTPSTVSAADTLSVELGVKFRSTQNGYVCGIRFYKGSTNTGTHIGKLWTSGGTNLATATFVNETASGWQQVSFASPVAITANTTYVASYLAPVGHYSNNNNYFTAGVTSSPLYAFSSAESGGNGVYQYGSGGFPTSTFQASNYWVDVVFTTNVGPDTTPPTVTSTLPASNATGVVPANPVSITFSETIQAATIEGTPSVPSQNFQLMNASNALVPASVTYNSSNNTATLIPVNPLAGSAPYTAKVTGGTGGVKDSAGNALAAVYNWSFTTGVDPCANGGNPIVCENSKTGNPSSEWDISGAGDPSIQGFATDISVNKGDTVTFKIDANTPNTANYRLDIYRMGYYNGAGARLVATVLPTSSTAQTQPACINNAAMGLIDCGNWGNSASWPVPTGAVSGIYFAKVIRQDGANSGKASHIVFVVRDDASTSDILFQTADTTWQAYNTSGGNTNISNSFYGGTGPGTGSGSGRAYKLSYNRPFNTRSVDNGQDWVFNAEYPMVRWLEANGYNVSYFTGVDSDRFGSLIRNHKLFLSNAHDEYWSGQQRANVEAARDAVLNPVNLAFFSGNEVFWKTRWENNIINTSGGLGTDGYRTLVCFKETHNYPNNPDPTTSWTGTWRDPRGTPPADGGRPENALLGTIFTVNDGATTSIAVPEADGKMRFWRNTSMATLASGTSATLPNGTLGYEWDEDLDNGFRPAGLVRLSTTIVPNAPVLTDYGSTFGSGTANHALTLYKAPSGAIVFGAGTVQWAWGLDSSHDRTVTPTDANMKQATVNLFADMGVQPSTIQSGLLPATASTDVTRPTSIIAAPASSANIALGSVVTINGTASDAVGGRVGGVEVSVDGGLSWHPATGRTNWTYSWTAPSTNGQVNIMSRAVDDSLNLEIPGAGITVNVGTGLDNTPPTAPSGLLATVNSSTQITLNWIASTDGGGLAAVPYRVERCLAALCTYAQIGTSTPTTFVDSSGLAANTTYQYRVQAVDLAGNLSLYSGFVAATTLAAPPPAPTAVNDIFLFRANILRTANSAGLLGSGVLANDTDSGNLPLTAQAVGTLPTGVTLTSNGVVTISRGTASSFRYRANNGGALSLPTTGALATLRIDAAPVAVLDTCTYNRAGNGSITAGTACAMAGTRIFSMNLIANDTDANVTTNVPTDGVGKTVSNAVITSVGTGVSVLANTFCGQTAIGTSTARARITNNCDGSISVEVAATAPVSPISLTYRAFDDLGAQSSATRTDTVTVQ